jgi:2-polyprenyl-3-methyl-5-hydroxy-6-metoxy-1,4-benzoquinol methylase
MKYFFDHARLPADRPLLQGVNAAADRLARKVEALRVQDSGLSDYCCRVLLEKRRVLTAYLQIYTYILSWALHRQARPYSDLKILEYGGGIGLMSMLARELGVGTVVYNDIYEVSCADAKHLADLLGLRADHYICGDIEDVIGYLQTSALDLDGIVSFDVIEHIYDIDAFLTRLASLRGRELKIAMASGANMYSRGYARRIMAFHRACELEGRKATFGFYDRDALRPYVEIRREIIGRVHSELSATELDILAARTRGLRQDDIARAVESYVRDGTLPDELPHPTNTCDPYTGNWQEHLMEPSALVHVLCRAGFRADWFSGYFSGRYGNFAKRTLARGANVIIGMLDKRAIRLGKFYMLYAVKDQQS